MGLTSPGGQDVGNNLPAIVDADPPTAALPLLQQVSLPSGLRHRGSEISRADADTISLYPTLLANAASGFRDSRLPEVVHRSMRLPPAERADLRQRIGEPFELSFYRAQCKALRLPGASGLLAWWSWLGNDGMDSASAFRIASPFESR